MQISSVVGYSDPPSENGVQWMGITFEVSILMLQSFASKQYSTEISHTVPGYEA